MKNLLMLFAFIAISNSCFSQNQNATKRKAPETYEEGEVRLEEVYKSVLDILKTKDEKKLLVKTQKDWLKYRESEAEFELLQIEQGEDKIKAKNNRKFELTKQRIQDLMAAYIIIRLGST
jgi:uncharacterized protein YecT (DUF1311 family)